MAQLNTVPLLLDLDSLTLPNPPKPSTMPHRNVDSMRLDILPIGYASPLGPLQPLIVTEHRHLVNPNWTWRRMPLVYDLGVSKPGQRKSQTTTEWLSTPPSRPYAKGNNIRMAPFPSPNRDHPQAPLLRPRRLRSPCAPRTVLSFLLHESGPPLLPKLDGSPFGDPHPWVVKDPAVS
ncbi:hypothetical protein FA13DRAFT_1796540 [Coprinellus micaceus]|uniref:Uncharacterized protein n=1 Tax=Coprinellus micaceus TaxID=71717 RepID=A0A4Y7STT1_COPMI|nr:hypothetical protein FA13DRAFT_1796540 [Coprinellus micaceus]